MFLLISTKTSRWSSGGGGSSAAQAGEQLSQGSLFAGRGRRGGTGGSGGLYRRSRGRWGGGGLCVLFGRSAGGASFNFAPSVLAEQVSVGRPFAPVGASTFLLLVQLLLQEQSKAAVLLLLLLSAQQLLLPLQPLLHGQPPHLQRGGTASLGEPDLVLLSQLRALPLGRWRLSICDQLIPESLILWVEAGVEGRRFWSVTI